jgi:hypothetical protein
MESTPERRREPRLRYHWPVWFAEDFAGILTQGQMVDVSSGGAAFTFYAHTASHNPGQHITARFSVPRYKPDESFDMAEFVRRGFICRVDSVNPGLRRIAVRFFDPLPFKPGEQPVAQLDSELALEPALV